MALGGEMEMADLPAGAHVAPRMTLHVTLPEPGTYQRCR